MKLLNSLLLVAFVCLTIYSSWNGRVHAEDDIEVDESSAPKVDEDIGKSREGSRTDDEVVQREEEQIKLDGLSVAEMKELRESSKQEFVAEVNRMMKLIINSLYKNKEIFLRELISNASDALDKIRFMSLTDKDVLGETEELSIRIKSDKENRMLHITDTGIGMTKDDMIKYLGTIAKSQTSEFLTKFQEAQASDNKQSMSDLIGQFGVGFYSAFLVADKVIVTSKNNQDEQYIWESDSSSFTVVQDPRGNTLGRGTTVSLHLKEEAREYLEEHKLREIITKYSQFINFNIYLWASKSVSEEVPVEDEEAAATATPKTDDDDASVEEAKDEKPKTKTVNKTVWDWELMNSAKPIWQRKPAEVTDEEYVEFYKSFTKDSQDPLVHTHFVAEGEVTFKSILYVPKVAPSDLFQNYNKKTDSIKLYVRRVFISETVDDLLPKYLSFVRGVVDSDDLPLNVSRETLQQNKLLKVIKKKLVRKILDMVKKMSEADFELFHKEYSTNVKLGVIEDSTNRVRLAKLLRFGSSAEDKTTTSLEKYVERMKEKQEFIYFIAGTDRDELEKSPFVERLLAKGYEVLYLTDPIDEYCMQSLPEFDGKRFQNVAKDGLNIDKSKQAEERLKELEKSYEPLINWIKDGPLKDKVENVKISTRLVKTPMALVANQFGYSGNMERITRAQAYQKSGGDSASQYYFGQKKILEVNPGHPLVKELLRRAESDSSDSQAKQMVELMFESATLRSGYELRDTAGFADRIEHMLRSALNVPLDEKVDEMPDFEEESEKEPADEQEVSAEEDKTDQTAEVCINH
uniref:Hsp90 beta n=1 Tax=Brachionus ibericus TaxID=183141 RepID=E5DVR6_9BILA|nr:Hsp90 beta [Brachionus ibericus]